MEQKDALVSTEITMQSLAELARQAVTHPRALQIATRNNSNYLLGPVHMVDEMPQREIVTTASQTGFAGEESSTSTASRERDTRFMAFCTNDGDQITVEQVKAVDQQHGNVTIRVVVHNGQHDATLLKVMWSEDSQEERQVMEGRLDTEKGERMWQESGGTIDSLNAIHNASALPQETIQRVGVLLSEALSSGDPDIPALVQASDFFSGLAETSVKNTPTVIEA